MYVGWFSVGKRSTHSPPPTPSGALLSQLASCKKFDWTFVAGQLAMEQFNECQGAVGSVPFGHVYSLDALYEWGAAEAVPVAADITPALQVRMCWQILWGTFNQAHTHHPPGHVLCQHDTRGLGKP